MIVPYENEPESSSAAQQRQGDPEETTAMYMPGANTPISDSGDGVSSQALANVSERSSESNTSPTTAEIPESSTETHQHQCRKRQRNTDQDKAEEERLTHQSARIREQKNKDHTR